MTLLSPDDVAPVKRDLDATLAALDRMLLGRPELHRLVLAGILARGHILLEGLPDSVRPRSSAPSRRSSTSTSSACSSLPT